MKLVSTIFLAIAAACFAVAHNAAAQVYSRQQLEQAQSEIQTQVAQCQAQVNAITPQQRAAAAMQGYVIPLPACMNSMPQWIAQERLIEAQLGHLNGDPRSLCEQQGYPRGCEAYRPR